MKNFKTYLAIAAYTLLLTGCKSTIENPVQTVDLNFVVKPRYSIENLTQTAVIRLESDSFNYTPVININCTNSLYPDVKISKDYERVERGQNLDVHVKSVDELVEVGVGANSVLLSRVPEEALLQALLINGSSLKGENFNQEVSDAYRFCKGFFDLKKIVKKGGKLMTRDVYQLVEAIYVHRLYGEKKGFIIENIMPELSKPHEVVYHAQDKDKKSIFKLTLKDYKLSKVSGNELHLYSLHRKFASSYDLVIENGSKLLTEQGELRDSPVFVVYKGLEDSSTSVDGALRFEVLVSDYNQFLKALSNAIDVYAAK